MPKVKLSKQMETWPSEQLRRIAEAPLEKWDANAWGGRYGDPGLSGCGCLAFHRFGLGYEEGLQAQIVVDQISLGILSTTHHSHPLYGDFEWFTQACDRFGIVRVVTAIQSKAIAILLDRELLQTLEPVAAVSV